MVISFIEGWCLPRWQNELSDIRTRRSALDFALLNYVKIETSAFHASVNPPDCPARPNSTALLSGKRSELARN